LGIDPVDGLAFQPHLAKKKGGGNPVGPQSEPGFAQCTDTCEQGYGFQQSQRL
jgi:hypothetical protein